MAKDEAMYTDWEPEPPPPPPLRTRPTRGADEDGQAMTLDMDERALGMLPSKAAELDARLDAALSAGSGLFLAADPGAVADLGDVENEVSPEAGEAEVDAEDTLVDETMLEMGEAASVEQSDNIRVFVRVRPPVSREGSQPCRDIVRVDAVQRSIHLLAEPPRIFAFDGVLGESSSQEEVFQLVGTTIGEACLSGYNGSIYVYGQTGSGKTYTMQGPVTTVQSMHTDDKRGIMCRILDMIFTEVAARRREGGNVEYRCKCSYLEIYREAITDLLEPSSTNLQVREDINRGIYVERLNEHTVWTVSDAFHVLWQGLHQRHVGATQMNELSSRSHAVFTLALEATSTTAGGVTSTRVARLNLIDLAGSERQSFDPHNPTLHERLRVKEAGSINRSLSALTNVIMSLSRVGQKSRRSAGGGHGAANQRRPFVRYRDSKLTLLLRDSLGGNSKTVIVANVSPSALCFGETLSTLKFAARAKHIRCTAVMNEKYSGTVESLMLEVKSLKQQFELLSTRGLIPGEVGTVSTASFAELGPQQANAQSSGNDADDDPLEVLIACGNDDLRRLFAQRRVRRLEILLAAALERERRCELRRHKLDKFTQYLNGLLEHKERYFDGLRDYFTVLVDTATQEGCYPPELTAKLIAFRQQLCRVPTDGRGLVPEDLPGSTDRDMEEESSLGGMVGGGLVGDGREAGTLSVSTLDSHQSLAQDGPAGNAARRSRSSGQVSSGLLGDAAGRRRGQHTLQQRGLWSRPLRNASFEGGRGSMADLSASIFAGLASGPWFPGEVDDEEEALMLIRQENRLLRRQLENHPELYRLAVENRLLKEHLASLVQQHALAREEPPWPKGHRHARRARDGSGGDAGAQAAPKAGSTAEAFGGTAGSGGGGLNREPSLTRTSRSCVFSGTGDDSGVGQMSEAPQASQSRGKTTLGQAIGGGVSGGDATKASAPFRPFPGIEDATQISPSSSSAESDNDAPLEFPPTPGADGAPEGAAGGAAMPGGTAGEVPAIPPHTFTTRVAREVEELLYLKSSLEDALKQLFRSSRAARAAAVEGFNEGFESGPPGSRVTHGLRDRAAALAATLHGAANTEVEPRQAAEILRGTAEALRFAEGMLAKGKGEPLWLTAGGGGGQDGEAAEGAGSGSMHAAGEGLDERDVFMSLMRSLPTEGPSLSRHGFASSAPHLSPARQASDLGIDSDLLGGNEASVNAPTLRLSSSTGSAGTRLMRNRSMIQLHRISEARVSSFGTGPSPVYAANERHGRRPHHHHHALHGSRRDLNLQRPGVAAMASGDTAYSTDMLQEAAQKVRQLCGHLEFVNDAYRDMREQYRPLQEEYFRRNQECRFLEAQCRRLDMHCRLLEELWDVVRNAVAAAKRKPPPTRRPKAASRGTWNSAWHSQEG